MEVGLAIGGVFLSSAMSALLDKLAPQGDLLNMFQKRKNDVKLLKKLKDILLGLQFVLTDAENKQASNRYVSRWLDELRNAVDSAEILIEEVNYETLRLKVKGKHQNLAETLLKHCRICNLCLGDDFFLNIKDKLEETIERLEDLQRQIGELGLREYCFPTKQETRPPSTSVVEDSNIFGRQNEIKDLIGRLLSEDANGKNLAVVPIVGMGGLGKTTLAKAVYNDERVKKHFVLKAWCCVSEPYDALRITKGLLQEIGKFDSKDDNNLNQLQVKLKESLKGKKFLVVLDDVWNDDYEQWYNLRSLFVQGDTGSKIIVTTRKQDVALMMGSGPINVGTLSNEASWALFKGHSLENRDPEEYPELEKVGRQIADKCKGFPLALKAIAGVLRCKPEVEEWRSILRSEIWELPSLLGGIFPALMLSYNDLPPDLKPCFAFCAIYPKDYQFCKDQVIHLWIANGVVNDFSSGNKYFLELRSRSLFERVPEFQSKPEGFLMHDLVNDLAQFASSKLCIRLEESQGSHMLEQCRHLSYSMGYWDFEKLICLQNKLEQLRTLLPTYSLSLSPHLSKRVLHNMLPGLTSLRALSLSHYEIKELPNDLFIKLKLLRFLDLSGARIKKLPDSFCALYNLETLLLSSCADLEELPPQMEKLINLRHLDISGTSRLNMPLHLSKLKSLQVLVGAKYLAGGSRMEDLGEAQNLYGSLSVVELQNVVDRREAVKAKMSMKDHVEKLSLEWSDSNADNSETKRDILDKLCPHENIKELQITRYRGRDFPNWLADPLLLKNCVQMCIVNCKNCYSLPVLGQLPSLKILSIRGMDGITEVTEEFYGSLSSKKPFTSLEKLVFEDMPEWKQWHALQFPKLENLSIKNCAQLMGKLPENLCSLIELKISGCAELSLETPIQLSSLKKFEVVGSRKVGVLFDEAQLFTSQLEGMKQIDKLCIDDCNSLTSFPFSILPSTLKRISISRCQKLKLEGPVGEMFLKKLEISECDCIDEISPELLPRARELRIVRCHNLNRFSVACGGTQMTDLKIEGCEKLKRLPERMQELLPSLKKLHLSRCPEIESFPEGGLPFNLQVLRISFCKKLVNGRKEWRLPCLRELEISHDGRDEEILAWELPSSIHRLIIRYMKTLSSQLLKSLTSLEYLWIEGYFPQIQSLPEEGQLPSSLSHLTIFRCRNLQSLSESALPSSLFRLSIWDCPNLQSLPVNGMPSSLSRLSIYSCPLVTPLLEYGKGEYWPNIAQIPNISIDGECL